MNKVTYSLSIFEHLQFLLSVIEDNHENTWEGCAGLGAILNFFIWLFIIDFVCYI